MTDQQFCLRWNNHQSTLISVFDTLLENGTLVDCTLAAEGQYLKAHKVVLSACSPYLETLLSQHYEKHPIVILKDVKFTELKSMMDYMYRGEVNISQDQLGTFLKAAESLQIKGLSENGEGDARDVGSTQGAKPQAARKTPANAATQQQRPEAAESPANRDGSISPTSRKRRRIRRSSDDDNHLDANSCDLPSQAQSTPIVPNIPASITSTPIKPPIVKPEVNDRIMDHNSLPPESGLLKEKIEPAEPLLEPKTEYLEDLNNDDSVEDLTLDDDDEMDMSQMSNMSNISRPGPSHGADLSNQGFAPWQLGNQSGTDEVFMAAQEAVNAQRDSQESGETEKATATEKETAVDKEPAASGTKAVIVAPQEPLKQIKKVIHIDTTLFKKKLAIVKEKAKKVPDEIKLPDDVDPVKWLQSNFIEVEVTSTETSGKTVPQVIEVVQEQSQEEEEEYEDVAEIDEEEEEAAVEEDEEEIEDEVKTDAYEEGKSDPMDILTERVKKQKFESVDDDMEFDKEAEKYKCKRCQKLFKVKSSVLNHLRNICVATPKFQCAYCPYKAKVAVSLRVHYARYHSTPATRVPSKTIPTTKGLKSRAAAAKMSIVEQAAQRAKIAKDSDSDSEWEERPKTVRKQVNKPAPEKLKADEETGLVEEKRFNYDADLRTFTCLTCDKTFKSERAVERHGRILCGEAKKQAHKCFFCPYAASTGVMVRQHMGHKHGKWPRMDENGVWIY